jgi:hypothetical protein
MANKTRIIRSVESTPNNFTALSNKLLQNNNLSLDTRGLLCYLISLPQDWIIYKENIQKQLGFGRKKMDRIWAEAKSFGYLKSEKFRESNGTWNYIYTITDVPLSTVPLSNDGLTNDGLTNGGKGYTIQSNKLQSNNLQNKELKKALNSSSNNTATDKSFEDIFRLNPNISALDYINGNY